MPASPHDALFKSTFEHPDIARGELELVLPADVRAHLDLATLQVQPGSFVDDEMQLAHTDLLYAVQTRAGQQAFVYVVFEHQSSFDATMPFRLLRYVVRVWERWQRDHKGAKTLPIVLPVLLHHGNGKWKAAPELASMLDGSPALLESVRPYLPHFRFLLDDLSAISPEALAARTLHALGRLVQLVLRSSRSRARLRRATPLIVAIAASLARDERARAQLQKLYRYLYQAAPPGMPAAEIQSIVLQIAGPEGAEDAMNAAEELIERGEAKGLRMAITSLFSARRLTLSDSARARIAACSDIATLTRWHERAATAAAEAEVFGEGAFIE